MTVYALRTFDDGHPPRAVWWLFDSERIIKGKAGQSLPQLRAEWEYTLRDDKRITELVRYKGRMRLSEAATTVSSHRRKQS